MALFCAMVAARKHGRSLRRLLNVLPIGDDVRSLGTPSGEPALRDVLITHLAHRWAQVERYRSVSSLVSTA